MKTLFVVLLSPLILSFPFYIKTLREKNDSLSRKMLNILMPSLLAAITHGVLFFLANERVAFVFYALYFISVIWISVGIFDFCSLYSESKVGKRVLKFFIVPFSILESCAIVLNIFVHFIFSLHTIAYGNETFFCIIPSFFFLVYIIFHYAVFVYCFLLLLIRLIDEVPSLRIKYFSLLAYILAMTVGNIIHMSSDFPFNFSILVYFACFTFAYHVLYNVIPERIIRKTLSMIADGLTNGIILFDMNGTCVYANPFAKKLFECDEGGMAESYVIQSYSYSKRNADIEPDADFSMTIDWQKGDKEYSFKVSDSFVKENETAFAHYYIIVDITGPKQQIKEEKHLRTHDKLTGLYNQDYFFEKVEHRLKYDRFTQYYLVVSDIVNFKLINDLHGKSFGDTVLLKMADCLRKYAAPDDIYGRLFNDHFVMLVPKFHYDEKFFVDVFKKEMGYLANISYTLVGHMGIYEISDSSIPVSVMCDRAFLALQSIKSDYKVAVAYYDDVLRLEVIKMQTLMNELPYALKFGQVVMYLQPQVKEDGKLVGAEALVRWNHPVQGIIPPADFIEIIEKINIISDVDRYVWECACAKLAEWKKSGHEELSISVNVSAKDFFTMDLYAIFTELVKKYDIPPRMLNLEITETAVIFDLENQLSLLKRLRDYGFVVEIDDFGSGYSSLNMLKDISVDVLKLDMSFLQKSVSDEKSQLILENIIRLAKGLGMKVVSEGVESEKQIQFLSKVGCDLFQGFYFSRPIPVSEFEKKYLNGD